MDISNNETSCKCIIPVNNTINNLQFPIDNKELFESNDNK